MDSTRWANIKDLFMTAFELPEHERSAFLDGCDADLRSEVEGLLRADGDAGGFINEPAMVDVGLTEHEQFDIYVGKQIDHYIIEGEIGHGGMGAVYLANRADASYDKQVAVKLIKRGMDTNAVLKRFVLERQILARLQHPNIANLLDGGSTADGVPYFVMEYVEGLPVTKYCDAHALSVDQRLELFRKICSAISYAHQNLVVHCDIKPSNILVTSDGTPKLLDFGIAKLLHPDRSLDTNEATATMFRVMTPEYASPEQMRGEPITTTGDVYSLGVVLYELLCGKRPFNLDGRMASGAAEFTLTPEPPKPSAVASDRLPGLNTSNEPGVATAPKSVTSNPKLLRGDLDNIVLKALAKEPERRYQSVQEFSEDIRRHIDGLPVIAVADSMSYRVSKFVKRHRTSVFAGSAIFLTLLTATAVTSWQTVVAQKERDKAERRFKDVRHLTSSFLFDFHDSIADLNGTTKAREMVVAKAQEYLDILSQEAGEDRDLLWELSTAYLKLGDVKGQPGFSRTGDTAAALQSYQRSLDIRRQLVALEPGNREYALGVSVALCRFGPIYQVLGQPGEAVVRMREAMEISDQLFPGSTDFATFESATRNAAFLGDALAEIGKYDDALTMYRKSLSIAEGMPGNIPERSIKRRLAVARERLGIIFGIRGEWQRSLDNQIKFLAISEQLYTLEPASLDYARIQATAFDKVGDSFRGLKNYPKALEYGKRGLAMYEDLFEKEPQNARAKKDVGDCSHHVAETLLASGDFRKAIQFLQKTVTLRRELVALDRSNVEYPHDLASSLTLYGEAMTASRNLTKSAEALQESRSLREPLVASYPERIDYRRELARLYADIGDVTAKLQSPQHAAESYEKSRSLWDALRDQNSLWANDLNISKIGTRKADKK